MMGVLNEGIAGNRVLSEGVGPSALARFDRDVLAQSGVTHVILLEGINDLGLGRRRASRCRRRPRSSPAIGRSIERAHAHGLKVIGGTLLPFEGTNLAVVPGYYSSEKDARRQAVNDWIRNGKAYDGVIDFDMALRDPGHPLQLLAAVQGRGQPAPERRGLPGDGQRREPCAVCDDNVVHRLQAGQPTDIS